jgi:3,4-dihydroxy 2-butanone 4-phosphate synthase/GTP cyclohydrolase II
MNVEGKRAIVGDATMTRRVAETTLPMRYGTARLVGYEGLDGGDHVALVVGEPFEKLSAEAPLVRIHSECFTGDIFGSLRCDCGPQLDEAMRRIAAAGAGVLIYLRQEGRGIGLLNKIKAYALQEQGLDTVEANEVLGFASDAREYDVAVAILEDLGVRRVRLMSNNPAKIEGLERLGVSVVERVPIVIQPVEDNLRYLETKQQKMGHLYRIANESAVAAALGPSLEVA